MQAQVYMQEQLHMQEQVSMQRCQGQSSKRQMVARDFAQQQLNPASCAS